MGLLQPINNISRALGLDIIDWEFWLPTGKLAFPHKLGFV